MSMSPPPKMGGAVEPGGSKKQMSGRAEGSLDGAAHSGRTYPVFGSLDVADRPYVDGVLGAWNFHHDAGQRSLV